MKQKEILKKALDKAQANGFVLKDDKNLVVVEHNILGIPTGNIFGYETIIFSHEFAKAFWHGEISGCIVCGRIVNACRCDIKSKSPHIYPGWKMGLIKMALAEDPLVDVIGKFLSNN